MYNIEISFRENNVECKEALIVSKAISHIKNAHKLALTVK